MPRSLKTVAVTIAAVVALLAFAPPRALAAKVTLEKPLKVITYTTDNKRLAGFLLAYTATSFDLKDAKGDVSSVEWTSIQPRNIYVIHQRAFGKKATADQWIQLGRLLLTIADDKASPLAERAFREALKVDDSVQSRIDQVKANTRPAAPAKPDTPPDAPSSETPPPPGLSIPGLGAPRGMLAWPDLSEAEHEAAIADAKIFAEQTKNQINDKLRLYETKYFLFYSDLDEREARKWQSLMDKMYNRLVEMFALERGKNIWKGKALVFVFKSPRDYQRFQVTMHRTNPGTSAGMCHSFSNGDVHIAFYRDEDEKRFAHVMVHESVHGFIHRYQSPVPVVSWANEGLAEWISMELVPTHKTRKVVFQESTAILRETGGSLRGMLDASHIAPWQYNVSNALTDTLIQFKRRGYVDFIKGIKTGMPWEASFEENMGMPIEKFLVGFGRAMKLDKVTR